MDPVQVAGQRVRDIVNTPRRRYALFQDKQRWARLCSAMDAIGDTQAAVRAYLDEPMKETKSNGWSYLIVYGILQVLYVQQDAAKTIASCLNLSLELPPELENIRDVRNDSIGHPTGRGGFISRISLSPEGFQLRIPIIKGKGGFQNVRIPAIADQQTEVMGRLLDRAVEQLVADELAHRKKFRDHPLRNALPQTLGYAIEKISAGLRDASEVPMALGGIDSIRTAVTHFRQLIAERGLTSAYEDSVGQTTSEVDYALDRILSRLKGGMSDWTYLDAEVYWFFLAEKVRELKQPLTRSTRTMSPMRSSSR